MTSNYQKLHIPCCIGDLKPTIKTIETKYTVSGNIFPIRVFNELASISSYCVWFICLCQRFSASIDYNTGSSDAIRTKTSTGQVTFGRYSLSFKFIGDYRSDRILDVPNGTKHSDWKSAGPYITSISDIVYGRKSQMLNILN